MLWLKFQKQELSFVSGGVVLEILQITERHDSRKNPTDMKIEHFRFLKGFCEIYLLISKAVLYNSSLFLAFGVTFIE